jgi:hypothetical protein
MSSEDDIQEHSESDGTASPPNNPAGESNPPVLPASASFQSPPPPTNRDTSTQEPDWRKNLTLAVEIVGLIALVVYTCFAGCQWKVANDTLTEIRNSKADTSRIITASETQACAAQRIAGASGRNAAAAESFSASAQGIETKTEEAVTHFQHLAGATEKSANAAKDASDIAAKQLELSERPWVDADIKLDGPFDFEEGGGANLPLKISVRNTGHSPATAVSFAWKVLIGSQALTAHNYRDQVCGDASKRATTAPQFGFALFPNLTFEQPFGVGIRKEEIEQWHKSKDFPGLIGGDVIFFPSVIICIAYRPGFNQTSVYHTAYIFDLVQLRSGTVDSGTVSYEFKIGKNVDQGHLILRMHGMNAVFAD